MVSAGELGLPEPEETGAELRRERGAQGGGGGKGFGAAGRRRRFRARSVRRLAARPASTRRAGAGPTKDFGLAMERVHRELEASGATDRTANFTCALALAAPDRRDQVFEGKVFGTLVWPPRGTRGFGYDPIFVPDGYSETFGEMDPELKELHVASHARLREADALASL